MEWKNEKDQIITSTTCTRNHFHKLKGNNLTMFLTDETTSLLNETKSSSQTDLIEFSKEFTFFFFFHP